jgi:hypothetical protein
MGSASQDVGIVMLGEPIGTYFLLFSANLTESQSLPVERQSTSNLSSAVCLPWSTASKIAWDRRSTNQVTALVNVWNE